MEKINTEYKIDFIECNRVYAKDKCRGFWMSLHQSQPKHKFNLKKNIHSFILKEIASVQADL